MATDVNNHDHRLVLLWQHFDKKTMVRVTPSTKVKSFFESEEGKKTNDHNGELERCPSDHRANVGVEMAVN